VEWRTGGANRVYAWISHKRTHSNDHGGVRELASVMDADMLGIARGWNEGHRVLVSDSQASIRRCPNLTSGMLDGRSWIDERVIKVANGDVTEDRRTR